MKLTDIFLEAIHHADQLVQLHNSLTTRNKRAIRPEWENKFFDAKLTDWPKKEGLWRSKNETILIVGKEGVSLSHHDFTSEALIVFLRAAMVMAMAAVDKILHESVSKHFVSLAKKGKLDGFVDLELSKSYRIAIESRKKKGVGGGIRTRPGSKIKTEVLDKLYRDSFLSLLGLQEVCGACGKRKIFERYGRTFKPKRSSKRLQEEWSKLYMRRNQIAHECDIVRKSKTKKVTFHKTTATELKDDIDKVCAFGKFLAKELG